MSWIEDTYQAVLGRKPNESDVDNIRSQNLTARQLSIQLLYSAEFLSAICAEAKEHHHAIIHGARIRLIRSLPRADVILDIGGANGSLVEFGYRHDYRRLIISDLPPEDRIAELQTVDLAKKWQWNPRVQVINDLSEIQNNSVDLAWAGQLIEHIAQEDLLAFLAEIKRVLRPGGRFCLDTPNALMARIHSPELLHPDHKYEYTPDELEEILGKYFEIENKLGLIPMPDSYEVRQFLYQEMPIGSFSENLNNCYIMYFSCRK